MITKIIHMEVECSDTLTSEALVEIILNQLNEEWMLKEYKINEITEIKVIRTIKDTPTQEVKEDENISNNL